jgi:hypothetical protein
MGDCDDNDFQMQHLTMLRRISGQEGCLGRETKNMRLGLFGSIGSCVASSNVVAKAK